MSCDPQDITIIKGKTFTRVLQWMSTPLIYKAITGITQAAPAVVTAPGHGVPDGWRVAVASVQGMREINAKLPGKGEPPLFSDFTRARPLNVNELELNEVNSLDFTAYDSGGTLIYYTPVDLAGATAQLQIRATETAENPPLVNLVSPTDIVIDNVAKSITITIPATDTEDYTFLSGVYELEITIAGNVTRLLKGNVTVEEEVVHA